MSKQAGSSPGHLSTVAAASRVPSADGGPARQHLFKFLWRRFRVNTGSSVATGASLIAIGVPLLFLVCSESARCRWTRKQDTPL